MHAAVHCHHIYIARETHIGLDGLLTRSGAVHAARGVMGIIPGSMAPARISHVSAVAEKTLLRRRAYTSATAGMIVSAISSSGLIENVSATPK